MKILAHLACFTAVLFASVIAHAQVVVTATLPGTTTTSAIAPTLATSSSFDMNGGNVVALLVTSEGTATTTNYAATFAGQTMTLGVSTNQGSQWAGIFYLLNPATSSGVFVITSDTSSGGFAYSAIALGNVGSVADVDAIRSTSSANTTPLDLNYTTATNSGFVLAAAVNNDYNGARPLSVAYGNPDTDLLSFLDVGSSGHLHVYGDVPTAGAQTDGYYGQYQRTAIATIAFETAEIFGSISWAPGNGDWDINTTTNWSDGVNPVVYKELFGIGNGVVFDDTASGTDITVTLNISVNPASVTASNSSRSYTISGTGSINGDASLTKSGSGTLTLGTANAYSGGTFLNGGTTVFSALTNLGAGDITFDGGTLQYNGNNDDISVRTVTFAAGGATLDVGATNVTYANPVGNGGAGGLTKLGSGPLTLSGANDYSGDTVVSQGALELVSGATLPNSPNIVLASGTVLDVYNGGGYILSAGAGQTLSGEGTVNGSLTVPAGTAVSPATSNTVGTLAITNFAVLDISGTLVLNATTNGSDLIVADYVTVNPGAVLTVPNPALTNGSYKLIQANGSFSGSLTYFAFNLGQPGKAGELVLVDEGGGTNAVYLEVSDLASDDITWHDNGTYPYWDQSGSNVWYLTGTTSPWAYTNGDIVRFDEVGSVSPVVYLDGTLKPSLVVVSNPVTDYYFYESTLGSRVSGSASLLKQGAGSLTISTANDNTGPTTIEQGVVNVYGSIGSGPVTNNGGLVLSHGTAQTIASITGTGALTQSGADTTVAGTADYTGPTTISSGTLTVGSGGLEGVMATSAITNDATLILNSSANWTYSMPDTGSGTLQKQGTNTLTLSGPNTRTGNTRVDAGKIILGNANQLKGSAQVQGGTLDLNGLDQLVTGLSGTSTSASIVNNAGTVTNTLTISNTTDYSFRAVIRDNDGAGGAIAVLKLGVGQEDWSYDNTYSGGTEIREGRARVTASQAFGTGPVKLTGGGINHASGSFTNTIQLLPPVGPTTNSINPQNNVTFVAPLVGAADLLVDYSSGGNNDTFRQAGGAAQWAGVTNTLYLRGSGGWFRSQTGTDLGSVTIDMNDSGVQINTDGARDVFLGALRGNTNTASLSGSSGSTYFVGAKGLTTTFAGRLGNTANNFVKLGSGALTLTGTNGFTGSLTVSNGTLVLAGDAAPSRMNAITVASGATLDVTGLAGGTLDVGTTNAAQTLAGNGTVNGSVVVQTNGTVSPGTSYGTLTITGDVSLDNDSLLDFELNTVGTVGSGTNDLLQVGGDLSLAGDSGTVYFNPTFPGLPVTGVTYTIITYGGNLTGDAGNLALKDPYTHLTATFDTTTTPGVITVTFTINPGDFQDLVWKGGYTNTWEAGPLTNWLSGATATNFYQYDNVTFNDSASSFVVSLNGTLTPSSLVVTNDANAYVFTNDLGGAIDGTVSLTKQGTNSLTLMGSHGLTGGATLGGGTLRITEDNALAGDTLGGTVVFEGGTIESIAQYTDIKNPLFVNSNQTGTVILYNDRCDIDGSLTGSGTLNVTAPSTSTADDRNDWEGTASAFTGTINISGGGNLNLRYNGSTFDGFAGATVNIDNEHIQTRCNSGGSTIQIGALVGTASATLSGSYYAGPVTYQIGVKNLDTTFAGVIEDGSANDARLTKVGTGALTLTGPNTASGSLTVSSGTLVLTNDAAPSSMSPITVGSGATLDVTGLAGSTLSLGTTNVAQTLAGNGTVNGSVLIGTNGTVTPGTSVGTLTLSSALTLNGTATMELDRTNSQTADLISAASFSGTGTVNVTNIGPDLVTGDTFQLFSDAVPGVTVNLPVSNALNTVEYVWTNKVAIDGSIELLSGVPAGNPTITFSVSGGTLTLNWPATGWSLQAQTNLLSVGLQTGTNDWTTLAGYEGATNATFTITKTNPTVFYRLTLP